MTAVLQRVVCAALRSRKTGRIVAGARHYDSVMRNVTSVNGKREPEWVGAEQGFIDQFGKFLTREEAWTVASIAHQLRPHPSQIPGTLFSEDLY